MDMIDPMFSNVLATYIAKIFEYLYSLVAKYIPEYHA